MVGYGWTESLTYPTGNISGNTIVNCTAGMYVFWSEVLKYTGNEFKGCTVGELFNGSDQISTGNKFVDCEVGTLITNGSRPTIKGNHYEGGATPIRILNCSGSKILENTMEVQTTMAIEVYWNETANLDHAIAQSNTINGRQIYYSYNEKDKVQTLNGYGQVTIANASRSRIMISDVGTCVTSIILSDDVDISGSNISKGLSLIGSDITGKGVAIDGHGSLEWSLSEDGSFMDLFNSSIKVKGSGGISLNSSELMLYSTDLDPSYSKMTNSSTLCQYNYFGISVLFDDNTTPVEGGEYKITSDGKILRGTELFGGSDQKTRKDGGAGPFWIEHTTSSDRSGRKEHRIEIEVNVTADRSWKEQRQLHDLSDHVERFVTSDIKAPSVPKNVQVESVDDGISLTWSRNLDDTVLYRVYCGINGTWSLRAEVHDAAYSDPTIPKGTVMKFRLTAVDDVGLESKPSIEVEGTSVDDLAPLPPTSLNAVNMDGNVILSWGRSPSLDVLIYEIYEVVKSGTAITEKTPYGSTADTTITLQGEFTLETLLSVRAVDESDKRSQFVEPVHAIPQDPTWPVISNVEWTFGASRASISFITDVPTKGNMFFGTSTTSVAAVGLDDLGTEHVFEMNGLKPRTRYYFYLYAVEPSGNSITDDNAGAFYTFVTYDSESMLTIVLVDEDGEPVGGATVNITREDETVKAVETSPGTYYAILLPGKWTVTVVSTDHRPVEPKAVELGNDQELNITINLVSIGWDKATLTVVVLDRDGVPIVGAIVKIDGIEYMTGDDGKATSGPLSTGSNHTLKVMAKGYADFEDSVFVSPKKKEKSMSVELKPQEATEKDFPWMLVIIAAILVILIILALVVFLILRRGSKVDDEGEEGPDKAEGDKEMIEDATIKEGKLKEEQGKPEKKEE